jgi:hypothetical protein
VRRARGARLAIAALLAIVPAARATGPDVEVVAADDTTFTYRERQQERVALDPAGGVYHRRGCPRIGATMEWSSPGAATMRGLARHACPVAAADEYLAHTVRRQPRDPGAVSVLFLGNSLTYFNETPSLAARIAAHEARPLRVDAATLSGASLDQLWTMTPALRKLWSTHWDYVVIQERGGRAPHDRGALFEEYVRRFADEARRSGAQPLLFETWCPQWEAANEALFERVARGTGARLVPVGRAWNALLRSGAFARLDSDGTHPNLAGSYLIACTVYAVVYGRSPLGLGFTFPGLGVKDEEYDSALLAQRLTAAEARSIQLAAWAAVRSVHGGNAAP